MQGERGSGHPGVHRTRAGDGNRGDDRVKLPTQAPARPDDLSQRAHRRVIGALGLVLPPLLYLLSAARPTDDLPRWTLLGSVSAYYYTGAVAVFVGVLFALSLFLFTYRGYQGVPADRIVGAVGGAAALCVALFPTRPPGKVPQLSWWTEATGNLHYAAAILLFVCFILFSAWLFRKSSIPRRRDRPRAKRARDDTCLVCGILMAVCVAWAGLASRKHAPIFWPESIAITAFAISWLVKGEVHETALAFSRRLMGRIGR
jgi:hypothetical protein